MLILTSFACTVLMFGMLGVNSTGSVAAFGALYGLFSGACASLPSFLRSQSSGTLTSASRRHIADGTYAGATGREPV